MTRPFTLEVLVDFLDDALRADHVWRARDVDGLMRALAELGVRRVSWAYYADERGGWRMPEFADGESSWARATATYRSLGHPLRVAVEAGHRYGMEVYAYYKPYETGVAMVAPEGSPEARTSGLLPHAGGRLCALDPFVVAHPHLRIQRRADDLPEGTGPICAIRLVKRDDAPTRVTAGHLQLWASVDNYRYERAAVPFTLTETVEPAPRDVADCGGAAVTRRGDPVRVLTLSGFRLDDPYLLVTTDFPDGPADFAHSGTALITALDAEGREVPGCIATGAGAWLAGKVDFRRWGLIFDYGWGSAVIALDAPNASGRDGFIAFARGRNPYLPAALCETEPAVQAFWLACLDAALDAGVDGVDFREENHCTHTDEPDAYGFNPVVLSRVTPGEDLRAAAARVRGEAYTAFLRAAKARLSARGVRLRYHLNMDHFRQDPPPCRALAYPANLHFDWRRWMAEGLLDEAVLRSYQLRRTMLTDAVGAEMIAQCRAQGIPIAFNHHVFDDDPWYLDEARRVIADGRFAGLILYENNNFTRTDAAGNCRVTLDVVRRICEEMGDSPRSTQSAQRSLR
ncbi:MAG TPA: hypothetical protein PK794_03000 [Armatimonadota bacterium]|nr:hypothetical protein [Armatimonadota bacterium]